VPDDDRGGWDDYVGSSGSHYMRGWRRRVAALVALALLLPTVVFVLAVAFQAVGRILHW
jgi:hypothetical protein